MLRLRIKTPGRPPATVEIDGPRVVIGRSPRNEVFLDDAFASRLHAELRDDGECCRVVDLGSANGTRINGETVTEAVEIAPGDRIEVGGSVIEVLEVPAAVEAARRSGQPAPPPAGLAGPGVGAVLQTVRRATGPVAELESAEAQAAERRRDPFAVISKVGVALLSSSSLQEVLQRIIELVFEGVAADRAYLFLLQGEGDELVCQAADERRPHEGGACELIAVSQSIREIVIERGQSLLTSNAQEDARFRHRQSIIIAGLRSVMAVPLAIGERVLGMLYVDSPLNANVFSEEDLRLLTTVASVAAIRVENALLLEQRLENERMKQQLARAREIQSRLLPGRPPAVPGYDLAGASFPCFEVGGDYFDFIVRADGQLVVALGDVSGKGMDAALLMSSLHAAVRAQAEGRAAVAELVGRVNRYLQSTIPPNKFVTFFYSRLDPATHRLTWANAGHNSPLLVRAGGEVTPLASSGLPLGISATATYREETVELAPGDLVVLYSDGISEAPGPGEEEYGADRLTEVVRRHAAATAGGVRDRVDEALVDFMAGAAAADDMTLVVVKRSG